MIPMSDSPILVKELCERFEKLYTGYVNDVAREACLGISAVNGVASKVLTGHNKS